MAITISSLTISALQQAPYAHAGDALTGRTARRWPVQAILTPADWLTLDEIYSTWRTARLADPDTMVSLDIGSTVEVSGAYYGASWTEVAAWFTEAPQPTAIGAMVGVSFELVDATEQLAVMLRELEVGVQVDDIESAAGTYTLGTVTLNLTAQPDGHDEGPTMELVGTGTHVIRGPLLATKVRQIEGWTQDVGADATIREWYEDTIAATPAAGDWFPVSPPVISQTPVIVAGARVTRYLVSIELRQVI